ncbi:hypothetical protein PPL_06890 [Heterostelium album PN500]|uniref:Uncharacterized protein n=1 Tax=Heterostelium pallidum (strain ATCC 26659 / Pp 5 / PN500) TaxID=670386 RepID=D3BDT7_HETP5|nr:hypothetical protein PPL_06890 [Heterostelium album PN500]EFA80068.1 hypothetical protein PPL_06890 [Heterostelium album PN500]|eukprot:XP_020432188.1 hypothetical protein PPL_06890 [Heterostelium album PN500]
MASKKYIVEYIFVRNKSNIAILSHTNSKGKSYYFTTRCLNWHKTPNPKEKLKSNYKYFDSNQKNILFPNEHGNSLVFLYPTSLLIKFIKKILRKFEDKCDFSSDEIYVFGELATFIEDDIKYKKTIFSKDQSSELEIKVHSLMSKIQNQNDHMELSESDGYGSESEGEYDGHASESEGESDGYDSDSDGESDGNASESDGEMDDSDVGDYNEEEKRIPDPEEIFHSIKFNTSSYQHLEILPQSRQEIARDLIQQLNELVKDGTRNYRNKLLDSLSKSKRKHSDSRRTVS